MEGWSRPERDYTFNLGHQACLVLPKLFDSDQYQLSIDVWPFIVPDRLPVQRIEVIARGAQVMHAAIDNRARQVISCEIPPHVIEDCETVDVAFRFPDAAAPANVTEGSLDTRILAFAFFSLAFSGRRLGNEAAPGPVILARRPATEATPTKGQQ